MTTYDFEWAKRIFNKIKETEKDLERVNEQLNKIDDNDIKVNRDKLLYMDTVYPSVVVVKMSEWKNFLEAVKSRIEYEIEQLKEEFNGI